MKKFFIVFVLALVPCASFGQKYEVIIQLQSGDTLVHRSVVNQISNLKKALPDAVIELVCHGPGIDFLTKVKGTYASRLQKMGFKDVNLTACEFSMAAHNLRKEDLVSFAGTVPSGVVEIVKKEKAGWLYLKLGF